MKVYYVTEHDDGQEESPDAILPGRGYLSRDDAIAAAIREIKAYGAEIFAMPPRRYFRLDEQPSWTGLQMDGSMPSRFSVREMDVHE